MGCGLICAVCSRFQILLLSSIAIGGSLVTTFSCQFFTYQSLDGEVWEGFDVPPFSKMSQASVGLFSYSESLASTDALGSACERYNDWKFIGESDNKFFQIAQVASMVAPILAFLGWIQILVEFLCCRLYGGLCLMSTLFLLAAAAQACTFLLFADTQFCLEPESVNECRLELGSYYSLGATVLYVVLSCLVSNTPPSPGQRNEGCCVYTGWRAKEPSSHPREITTPANADPEMAPKQADKSLNHPSTEQEEIQDEELGKQQEIIEEEVLLVQDENGQQIVVEEEEIVDDANGNQVVVEEQEIVEGENGEQMVVEEELVVEDADGNHVVVQEEVVEEPPAAQADAQAAPNV